MTNEPDAPREYTDSVPVRADESTPLLAAAREDPEPVEEPGELVLAESDVTGKRWRVTILIFVLLILTNTFGLLQNSAQVQLFENIYCSKYYTGHPSSKPPSDGSSCKVDAVQANLAFLRGWKSFLDFLPGIMITNATRYN